jgi:type IX secretion system PorP/SprF family membrane protein
MTIKFARIYIFIHTLVGLFVLNASGQDHLYSQFFNSPVYLNPALNGQFEGDFRMNLIYRNQYTSSGNNSNYMTASVDYNVPQFGGGVGLMYSHSSEGNAYLVTNNIAGIYSYSVGSDEYVLSFGLQAGVSNQGIDYSKLVFDDQIDPRYGIIPGSVSEAAGSLDYNNRYYFDSGAGINLVVGDFMIGGAGQHLNMPNTSLSGAPAKLPIRGTGYISYRLDLNRDDNIDDDEKSYIIPSAVYYKQAEAQSASVGLEYKHKSVSAGLWYRTGGTDGPSAVVVSLIFDLFVNKDTGEKFKLGVSHDVPTSGLNYSNTSGTTEGSINYQTVNPAREDDYHLFQGARRCYDFY